MSVQCEIIHTTPWNLWAFCNGVSSEEIKQDHGLKDAIENSVRRHDLVLEYGEKRIELSYKELSTTIEKIITGQTIEDIERCARDGYIAIRDDSGHLLLRYHPQRNMIEIQRRGVKTNIDLNQYKQSAMSATSQGGDHEYSG